MQESQGLLATIVVPLTEVGGGGEVVGKEWNRKRKGVVENSHISVEKSTEEGMSEPCVSPY